MLKIKKMLTKSIKSSFRFYWLGAYVLGLRPRVSSVHLFKARRQPHALKREQNISARSSTAFSRVLWTLMMASETHSCISLLSLVSSLILLVCLQTGLHQFARNQQSLTNVEVYLHCQREVLVSGPKSQSPSICTLITCSRSRSKFLQNGCLSPRIHVLSESS